MREFITLPTTKLVNFSRCVDIVNRSVMNSEFASSVLIKTISPEYIELLNLCEPYVVDMVIENKTHCMFPPVVIERDVFNKLTHGKDDVRIGMKEDKWYFETIGVDVFLRTKLTDLSIYDTDLGIDVSDSDVKEIDAEAFTEFSRAYQLTSGNAPSEQLAVSTGGRIYFRTAGASANFKSPFNLDGVFGNSVINLIAMAVETERNLHIAQVSRSVVITGDELTIKAPLRRNDADTELVKSAEELMIKDEAEASLDIQTMMTFLKKINGLGYFSQSVQLTPSKEHVTLKVYSQDLSNSWEYRFNGHSDVTDVQYIFNLPVLLQFFSIMDNCPKFNWCKVGLKVMTGDNLINLRRQIRL